MTLRIYISKAEHFMFIVWKLKYLFIVSTILYGTYTQQQHLYILEMKIGGSCEMYFILKTSFHYINIYRIANMAAMYSVYIDPIVFVVINPL